MTDPWTDRLSEYLDDELTTRERRQLEAHLETCQACERVLADLQVVVSRAATINHRPPEHDLWPAIQARLEERTAPVPFWRAWLGSGSPRFNLTFAQLSVAALALVLVAAGATWMIRGRLVTPGSQVATTGGASTAPSAAPEPGSDGASIVFANFADPQYDAAVADLQKALENGRDRLDPRTIEIVEKNLKIIDQAIDQAREALKADPANTYLNSYVADARRRKLALLREATDLADRSS
jgi:tetratricopeptide (TPR) repeat protein